MKEKVVLGMSGGVDSSTAAYLLKRKGYEVIGITLNQYQNRISKDAEDAKELAKKLGIEYHTINIYQEFQNKVINYFLDTYNSGETPSPCIICDEEIKFKTLFQIAEEYKAGYVATGHYTSVEYNEKFSKHLLKGVHSIIKDQSYMLYRLDSEKLKRLLFPLQNYSKTEIRKIAEEAGIELYDKKDSQGICFAKEGYKKFLKDKLAEKIKEGFFVDKKGNILGKHEGYQLYTFGQRRGLGINFSKPVFITDIRAEKNEIVLGEYEELLVKEIELVNYKFNVAPEFLVGMRLLGRARFSSHGFYGSIYLKNKKIYFRYEIENTHNADGQHLVIFYDNFVLGGGIIRRIK